LNILSFNRHFYFWGLIALAALVVAFYLLQLPTLLSTVVIAGFTYGLLMPLFVSAYVYDFSGYYKLDWLKQYLPKDSPSVHLVNINAGFDETSFLIKDILPEAQMHVFDFYDEKRHTEAAIIRARKVSLTYPNTREMDGYRIPMADSSTDVVFLLSAAHEIREFGEKVEFLSECKRICTPTGKIIMVEHMRDVPNFLAFTIGFFHFFSKGTWKKAFSSAGFSSLIHKKFTPFMSVFVYSK